MRMRRLVPIFLGLVIVLAAVFALGQKKPKSGPLGGTWECTAHGGAQGDIKFTLYLDQEKGSDTVTGSVSSPMGGTDISAGTMKKNEIEIHFDTPQGDYQLTGHLKKGELSGKWSSDTDSGTWEGTKRQDSEGK